MRKSLKVVAIVLAILIIFSTVAFARPVKKAPPRKTGTTATTATTATTTAYNVTKVDERWAMSDGVKLPVSVYWPVQKTQGETFPVVVFVHAWDTNKSIYDGLAPKYASKGYVGVTYTVRGWFAAEGTINCIDPDYEMKDLSTIITLVGQDARFPVAKDSIGPIVGVTGYSMGGVHSFLAAPRLNPRAGDPGDPRIRAVVPMHGGADLLTSIYPNGAVKFFWATMLVVGSYMGNVAGAMINVLSVLTDPDMDAWQKLSSVMSIMSSGQGLINSVDPGLARIYAIATQRQEAYEEEAKMYLKKRSARWWCDEELDGKVEHPITAPMLIVAGFNDDLFIPNEGLGVFTSMISAPHRIIIENHGHIGGMDMPINLGQPKDPEKEWIMQEVSNWFDHFLKGASNGVEQEPAVTYYRDWGSTRYGTASQWPPTGTQNIPYYLGGGTGFRQGTLTTEPSASATPDLLLNTGFSGSISVPYINDATSLIGGQDMAIPENMTLLDMPYQHYTYDTAPVTSDTLVEGTPRMVLTYQSSNQFTQIIPRLYDVAPDGTRALICRGWYEGNNKNTWSRITTAGAPIEMVACSHMVKAGHKIELELRTSDMIETWPLWGLSFINIFHDNPSPSCVIVPVNSQ